MADDAPETFSKSDLVKEFAALYALHQDKIGLAARNFKGGFYRNQTSVEIAAITGSQT